MVIENWPLIVCGPILRRVEQTIASCWIALREECRVKFSIWLGPVDTGSNPGTFDSSNANFEGESKTIRIGENLHVTLVIVTLPQGSAFLPGEIYSYNITLTKSDGEKDLKSLKLLENISQDDLDDNY